MQLKPLTLGTGHYLSPGGEGFFWRGLLDFRRTKGGDHRKLWKDSEGGPLKFAWKMKTVGEGESHQMLLGGITSVK